MTGSGARPRLRVGVYNRFWTTAGGGEKFAGGIAQALARDHDVELIGHGGTSVAELASALQLDLAGVTMRSVEPSPTAVEEASADYDLFVNASYGSLLRNRARHGLYVVHFPVLGAPEPTGWRRFLLRAAGRMAKIIGAPLEPARWTGGAYAIEPLGPITHRWTDGDGVLQVSDTQSGHVSPLAVSPGSSVGPTRGVIRSLAANRRRFAATDPVSDGAAPGVPPRWVTARTRSVRLRRRAGRRLTVVCGRLVGPDADRLTVEVIAGGELLAQRTISARRRRLQLPVAIVRVRLPAGPHDHDEADDADTDAARQAPIDGWTVHVRSDTHVPRGRRSDERLLGVSVIAVLAGPYRHQLLQLVHQPLAAASSDLSFLRSYDRIAANSAFTARWVRRLWAIEPALLHPPVSPMAAGEKGPVILHVGRFFPPRAGHSKRQAELVGAFRRLVERGAADRWELHLVGGCDDEGRPYLDAVRAQIGQLSVHVHDNAPREVLRDLFARASIYWPATGLGEDPDAHPERMEHFGISTVEAMSAGAVPVCIGIAGQLEVFDDGVEGFHFATVDELVDRTAQLIADPARRVRMGAAASARAARYGDAAFAERLAALVPDVTPAAPTR